MTDAYDVTLDRTPGRVVVKLYRDGDGTAPLEWSRLEFAQRVALPVPEPIVADLESVWFGRPAVVMSRLPGRPDLTPKDIDSWVGALAQALAELHETPLDGAEGAVTRPPRFETWRAPAGEHDPLTAAAVGAVTARLPLRHVRARPHSRRLPPGQRPLAPRPHQWCRRLERSTARHPVGTTSRIAEPRCAYTTDRTSPIASPTHTRASSATPLTNSPCTTSCVCSSSRHYLAESLAADREQGHVPNYQLSVAHLDEHVRRALKRLDP